MTLELTQHEGDAGGRRFEGDVHPVGEQPGPGGEVPPVLPPDGLHHLLGGHLLQALEVRAIVGQGQALGGVPPGDIWVQGGSPRQPRPVDEAPHLNAREEPEPEGSPRPVPQKGDLLGVPPKMFDVTGYPHQGGMEVRRRLPPGGRGVHTFSHPGESHDPKGPPPDTRAHHHHLEVGGHAARMLPQKGPVEVPPNAGPPNVHHHRKGRIVTQFGGKNIEVQAIFTATDRCPLKKKLMLAN